jgi:hypothetical protein
MAGKVYVEMKTFESQQPPPHQKCFVIRGGNAFVATPCYGLHEPWWVPSTVDGETAPINILPTDRWTSMPGPPPVHKLVPINPTPEMVEAGNRADSTASTHRTAALVYRAMLDAAPTFQTVSWRALGPDGWVYGIDGCDHDWIRVENAVVSNGALCSKCKAVASWSDVCPR